MLDRLDAEHRHHGQAHHDTQRDRGEAAHGEASNAQKPDGDDPGPGRVAGE